MNEDERLELVKSVHRHEPDVSVLISRKGVEADLLNPWDYPITSVCTICGEKIRTRAIFVDTDWYATDG